MKQPTYWCVFDGAGKPWHRSISLSERGAMEFAEDWALSRSWKELEDAGLTVRRVRIVEVEKK